MRENFGEFNPNQPTVNLLADGRRNELTADFTYTDSTAVKWTAPKGFVSDGASIPRAFWTFVGGPWDGKYRDAAIIHDQYCVTKSAPSPAVHRMFHLACRAGGLGKTEAEVLYAAVRLGGPRWGDDANERRAWRTVHKIEFDALIVVPVIEQYIAESNPSLDEIESLSADVLTDFIDLL